MPSYCYERLSPGNIRLLRLMPHGGNAAAPMQCHLMQYELHREQDHLYEALSYVWGDPTDTRPIHLGEYDFNVTSNLHAALSRLRNHSLERIIWVDAICINQTDYEEKEHQIQAMAAIFGQANCVIVWLGETADNSDQALECIRAATEEHNEYWTPPSETKQAVVVLLQRQWFRRIWVLQEIALARRIQIICGSGTINGHAFSLGLNNLDLPKDEQTEIRSTIRSIVSLIRGAAFRPQYATQPHAGRPLAELIDAFHSREATIRHDKVYALLGMSSDKPAGLAPHYNLPWKTVLHQLTTAILSESVVVHSWDGGVINVLKGKGYVLGRVRSVERDFRSYDRQHLDIWFNTGPESQNCEKSWGTHWTLPVSAKSIREKDIICLLEGASKPSILRAGEHHCAVIVAVAAIPGELQRDLGLPQRRYTYSRHELTLLWDWGAHPSDPCRYEPSLQIDSSPLQREKTPAAQVEISSRIAMILWDAGIEDEAEKQLSKVKDEAEKIHGKDHPTTLAILTRLAFMNLKDKLKPWLFEDLVKKGERLLLRVIETRKRTQGISHQDTLDSIADLVSAYIELNVSAPFPGLADMYLPIEAAVRNRTVIPEDAMVHAAKVEAPRFWRILLSLQDDIIPPITERILMAATENYWDATPVTELLSKRRDDQVQK